MKFLSNLKDWLKGLSQKRTPNEYQPPYVSSEPKQTILNARGEPTKLSQIKYIDLVAGISQSTAYECEHTLVVIPIRRHELAKSSIWNKLTFEERQMFFEGIVFFKHLKDKDQAISIMESFSPKSCLFFYSRDDLNYQTYTVTQIKPEDESKA